MASLTKRFYTGDGIETDYLWDVPYIAEADVHGYVDSIEVSISFIDPTHVRFAVAPADTTAIEIRRSTSMTAPRYSFPNKSHITSTRLDGNSEQQLFLHQEVGDIAGDDVDAALSAAQAAASAAAASTSETNAGASETSATASKDAAAISALACFNYEALTDADATATAADVVVTTQDAIDTAADAVATATDASTASNAATSAASSSGSAAVSAASALGYAVAANAVHLGGWASDPTLDNYGNPLTEGSTYLNTTLSPQKMKVYTDVGWVLQATSAATNAVDVAVTDTIGELDATEAEAGLAELATRKSLLPNGEFKADLVNWTDTSTGSGVMALDTSTYTLTGNTMTLTRAASGDVAEATSNKFNVDPNTSLLCLLSQIESTAILHYTDVLLNRYDAAGSLLSTITGSTLFSVATWVDQKFLFTAAEVGAAVSCELVLRTRIFSDSSVPTTMHFTRAAIYAAEDSLFAPHIATWNPASSVSSALNAIAPTTGTWTPTVYGSTTPGTGWTYTSSGNYSRIGNMLYIDFTIHITVKSTDAVGNVEIGGQTGDVAHVTGGGASGVLKTATYVDWGTDVMAFVPQPIASTALSIAKIRQADVVSSLGIADISDGCRLVGSLVIEVS